MRGSVVDVKRPRPTADVDSERQPGEGLLKDTLTQITGEKEAVWLLAG
jgi:hypothetical protein